MAEVGTDLTKAKQLLEQDQLVAIPTETVYGLAGNALSPAAITKIFTTKNRPHFDPLIVHVPDIESCARYAEEVPPLAQKLAKKFWPGALTLLLKKKDIIPDLVTSGLDTVGLRCPNHVLTQSLLRSLPFPLAAPSANPFGYVSPTTAAHVNEQLGDKLHYILDGGPCSIGIESTIVGFEGAETVIYRLGGISAEAIEAVTGPVRITLHSSSNPTAPGQLKSHYAPQKKLILGKIEDHLKDYRAEEVAVIAFQKSQPDIPISQQIILSPTGSLEEAAQHLFAALRALDKQNISVILAEPVPDIGLGRAINDRLRRAAAE